MAYVQITVSLTAPQYRLLAKIAAGKTIDPRQPVQVHHLIEHLVAGAVDPKRARPEAHKVDLECLRDLHAARLSDADIARRVGASTSSVRRARIGLGLPAVAGPGRRRKESA